ncbi:MAG: hypothetical protein IT529_15440 [Burkholderiales bacterium]|nr:hypothetical protein [Burkholderiales bacterium]
MRRHARYCSLAIMALCAAPAQALVVSYNDFSDTTGLTLVGSAGTAVTGDGTILRLTRATFGQSGAAYSTTAVTLGTNATFSTTFRFRFTGAGGINPADGITFVLAASPNGLGGAGVGMGYTGVGNSVAIEFDTYNNAGFGLGNNDGNSSNHVSVDTNGILQNLALHNVYGNASCGFPGGSPPQNNHLVPGCMSNGNIWTVVMGYDGTSLDVSLRDGNSPFDVAIANFAIDIGSLLGANTAYVGFTSATGSGYLNHDILNWQFANTTELAGIPLPGTLALAAIGLAAIGFGRVRRG